MTRTKTLQKVQKKSKYFIPDQRIFILIGNASYANRRKDQGYAGFTDLDAVSDDLNNMQNGLKSILGAQDSEI